MPSYKVHEVLGIVVWLVYLASLLLRHFTPKAILTFAPIAFALCIVGSLLPDIDHKGSKISKYANYVLSLTIFILCLSFLAPSISSIEQMVYVFSVSALITIAVIIFLRALIPKHRGPIHSFKAAVGYFLFSSLFAYALSHNPVESLIIGLMAFLTYAGHLLLDKV